MHKRYDAHATQKTDIVFNIIMLTHQFHHLLTNCWDSRHVQLAKYIAFDEETDVQVKTPSSGAQGPTNRANYIRQLVF